MKNKSKSVESIFTILLDHYPDPKTELIFENPFQLLIAVILSAQCTDERVNSVTPELFKKYPDAEKLASADAQAVENIIHSCGFFRAKAKAIIATAHDIKTTFKNEVPRSMEALTSLRGVGRKTASVVMNQAYGLPAIAVDTHVARVAQRLGWTKAKDPERIEYDLCDLIPKKQWAIVNTLLILHGRRICKARKPKCEICPVAAYCPSACPNQTKVSSLKKVSKKVLHAT